MTRRSTLTAAVAAAAAFVSFGVGMSQAGAASSARPTVTAHIAKNSKLTIAKTLQPGLVRFHVTGGKAHQLEFAKARHSGSKGRLIADIKAFGQSGNPTKLEKDFTLLGAGNGGSDFWLKLAKGKYYAVDTKPNVPKKANIATVVVKGSTWNAPTPKLAGTVTAVKDMTWSKKPAHIKHAGNLRFQNKSSNTHFVFLAELKKGASFAKAKQAIMSNTDPSPYFAGPSFDGGVQSPGTTSVVTFSLPKGRYILTCFWSNANGMTHASMGMIREINLK